MSSPHHDKHVNGSTDEAPAAEPNTAHDWIGAATVSLTEQLAKYANFRQSYRTREKERVDVLEVYCKDCRRPYDDVADKPCEAKVNNHHLIGGHPEERKKRKVHTPPPGSVVVPGPRINRRGIGAVVNGEA